MEAPRTNRPTLDALRHMPVSDVIALPAEHRALLQTDARAALDAAKRMQDWIEAAIALRYEQRAVGARAAAGKDTGIVQAGFINDTNTDDELWAGRAEVVGKINQGFVKNLVAGVAYSDRSKSRDIIQNFLSLPGPSPFIAQGATTRLAIPGDALYDPRASLAFLGFGPQVTYNPIALIENGTYVLTEVQSSDLPIPGDWTVNEKVYTGYLRADLESGSLTGNLGAQFVFTDQSSSGFNSPGGINAVLTPTTDGAKYSHFLPSLSLNYELTDNMKRTFLAEPSSSSSISSMSSSLK